MTLKGNDNGKNDSLNVVAMRKSKDEINDEFNERCKASLDEMKSLIDEDGCETIACVMVSPNGKMVRHYFINDTNLRLSILSLVGALDMTKKSVGEEMDAFAQTER